MYRNGQYLGTRPVPDNVARSGAFAINNTEADLTVGSSVQPAAKFDYVIDPQVFFDSFSFGEVYSDLNNLEMRCLISLMVIAVMFSKAAFHVYELLYV